MARNVLRPFRPFRFRRPFGARWFANRAAQLAVALCVLMAILSLGSAHEPPAPKDRPPARLALAPVTDDPRLPRVLLIGDSISIGYTLPVRELLAGKANVHRPPENCGPTRLGLKRLDAWLGKKPWNVIHFNFGLHDLKYVDASGKRVAPDQGARQIPPKEYEQNLRRIVTRLRETGAVLIWCTTTPVPSGASGREPGDAARYNKIAARVMRQTLGEERVINDPYAFALPRIEDIQRKANVHFTSEGSQALAAEVAQVIERHLPKKELAAAPAARGVVYHDVNGNGAWDAAVDRPLADIRVSNGREIVATDAGGRYHLPIDDDTTLFVIKPRGWRTPISADQLPRFYYIHKPNGSPSQRFPGIAPTGSLPESVDFPLYPQQEPKQFKAILFGDPQPRNQREVDYVTHDVVEELVGTDASFGVTLGDIAFDDLDTFQPQARAIAVLGIPWYNVIGNHDMNYDARRDRDSDETFGRVFGPSYYAFDYGPVHFLVLDDVEWLIDEEGKGRYQGGLGPDQRAFIRHDLAQIPHDQLVVLMMHIPLTDVRDRHDLFRLIEKRPFCMSISAHLHTHEHRFITRDDGWRGPQPHHHVINVTVSGSWWSGMPDERGIPHTLMADGAPNGYSIITFDGHQYKLRLKAAARPSDYQMNIYAPESVRRGSTAETDVLVNVFNGSQRSTVEMAVGEGGEWSAMERVSVQDPEFKRVHEQETAIRKALEARGTNPDTVLLQLTKPKVSTHIWRARLPAGLSPGTYPIRIRTTDMHGQADQAVRILRVEQ